MALMGAVFSEETELSHGVRNGLSGISPDEFEAGFVTWIAQLDTCRQRGESM
jgi:hypothetical protein